MTTKHYKDWSRLLAMMRFPPLVMDALQGLPLEGYHFAILLGVPLLLTMGTIVLARWDYGPSTLKIATASREETCLERRERFHDHEVSS